MTACSARVDQENCFKGLICPDVSPPKMSDAALSLRNVSPNETSSPGKSPTSINSPEDCVFSSGKPKEAYDPFTDSIGKSNCAFSTTQGSHKPAPHLQTSTALTAVANLEKKGHAITHVDEASSVKDVQPLRQSEAFTCCQTSTTTPVLTSNNNNNTNAICNHNIDIPETPALSFIHRSYSMLQFNEMKMIHSLANDDDDTDSGVSLDDSVHVRRYSLDSDDDLSIEDQLDAIHIDPQRNQVTPQEIRISSGQTPDDGGAFFIGDGDEDNSLPSGRIQSPKRNDDKYHSGGAPRLELMSNSMGMRRSLSSIQFSSFADELSSNKTLLRSGFMMPLDPLHEHEEDEEDEKKDDDSLTVEHDSASDPDYRGHLQKEEEASSPKDDEECSKPGKENYSHTKRHSFKGMKRILSFNKLRKLKGKKDNLEGDTNSHHDRSKKGFGGRSISKKSPNRSLSSSHYDGRNEFESLSVSLHSHRGLNLGLGLLDLSSVKVTPSPDTSYHEILLDVGDEKKDDSEPQDLLVTSSKALDLQRSSHSNGTKPIKSCMKKVSSYCNLDSTSFHNDSISIPSVGNDLQSQSSNKSNNSTMKRVTSFSNIEIREYDIVIGDTIPHDGPPVSIGWNYDEGQVRRFDLEYYEKTRAARRTRSQMYMGSKLRMFLLMKDQGYSAKEIEQASKNAARVRKRRNKVKRWDSFKTTLKLGR